MLRKEPNKRGYLIGVLRIGIELRTNMGAVRDALDDCPGLFLVSDGSGLRFYAVSDNEEDHFYMVDISGDRISIETHSKVSPIYFLQEAILRFLFLAAALKKDCEFRLQDLFPYLIELLAGRQLEYIAAELERNSGGRDTDLMLAKKISELMRENVALREKKARLELLSRKLLTDMIIMRYNHDSTVEGVAAENGLDPSEVNAALGSMSERGYRVVHSKEKKFSLVRA